jgi:hypothetical protein
MAIRYQRILVDVTIQPCQAKKEHPGIIQHYYLYFLYQYGGFLKSCDRVERNIQENFSSWRT